LKELEGSNFQENPKLSWKQEQLKRKLQNLDAKIAHFSSAGPYHSFGRGHPGFGPQSEDRHCQFLAMKKEKIVARLKELEGADFQANPGLQWKKDRLEQKLHFLEAKLTNKDAGNCPRFGGRGQHKRFHGPAHHGYHGPMGRGSYGYHHPMGHHGAWNERRCPNLSAKKEWLEARLKELEGADFTANPGLLWKQEHLKRKLQKIETRLAHTPTGMENIPPNPETVPQSTQKPQELHKDDIRKIRENLKQEKQAAVAQLKSKREAFRSAKRNTGGQGEELAKLQEEFMKAKEEAFQKKRALREFKTKNCTGQEDY